MHGTYIQDLLLLALELRHQLRELLLWTATHKLSATLPMHNIKGHLIADKLQHTQVNKDTKALIPNSAAAKPNPDRSSNESTK